MTKVKEKLYDHRFGLFFFIVLIVYNFIANSFKWGEITGNTYSFHVVDFSIGFCSKLLPGAVCNLLFDNITYEKLLIYLSTLMIIFFALISFLLDKLINKTKDTIKTQTLVIVLFFISGVCTFAFHFEYLVWFDFYWLFAAVLCFFCLMKKQTYFLIIPLMIAAIMAHYAVLVCYIPFIVIIVMYKISITENKKEKIYLSVVCLCAIVASLVFGIYMISSENENINLTMEEFNQFLASRGVKEENFEFYDFAFFRDEVIDSYKGNENTGILENINSLDTSKMSLSVFLQMFIQQIFVTVFISDMKTSVRYILLLLPLIIIIYRLILIDFTLDKKNCLKRFSIICSILLFWVTFILGRVLSSDTLRWFSDGLIPLMAFLLYVIYKSSDELKVKIKEKLSTVPVSAVVIYYAIYAIMAV